MFKKVLAATDMLKRCDPPVKTAIKIARQNYGEFYILHVLEDTAKTLHQVGRSNSAENEIINETKYKELIKKDIESKWADDYQFCSKYEIKVTTGLPWEEIVKWARDKGPDLIVLGPHDEKNKQKRSAGPIRAIGSTIEGVVRREPCPVIIVNRLMPDEQLDFKKVVVCVDFSRSCSSALKFAIKLAQELRSNLFIFHMLPIPPSTEYSQADYFRNFQITEQKLEEFCKEIPNGIKFECNVWGGAFPHLEVLEYARRQTADLVVMGSHTKESSGKWYVGSAVERVSCRSLCPVMVVSDPEVLLN
jgi:nucleotide-binding universal stress UspA family protein